MRLSRRGVTVPAGVGVARVADCAAVAVVIGETVRLAVGFVNHSPVAVTGRPNSFLLAEGVLRAMRMANCTPRPA